MAQITVSARVGIALCRGNDGDASHLAPRSCTTFAASSPITMPLSRSVPRLERMRLSLKHVGVHVMTDERPGVFAAQLMTDDRSDQIERNPHLREHGRERSSKVMRGEYGDRQCCPARQQIVADMGRGHDHALLQQEQGSLLDTR